MKKNYSLFLRACLTCSLCFLSPTQLRADDDDFDDMEQWETSFDDFVGDVSADDLLRCSITPADVLNVITNPADNILIQNFLQQNLKRQNFPKIICNPLSHQLCRVCLYAK